MIVAGSFGNLIGLYPVFYNFDVVKKHVRPFTLVFGFCLINSFLFSQDSLYKVYSIKFSGYKTKLSKEAVVTLNEIARIMKDEPGYNFKIASCGGTENEKFNVANWDRVNNTITYLVEKKGIKAERLIFSYEEGKDCNTIDLQWTDEKVTTDPPPHPTLRKRQ